MKLLVLGGNRFFGKRLVELALAEGHDVTILNRGNSPSVSHPHLESLKADRGDRISLQAVFADRKWDVVYDQIGFASEEAKIAVDLLSDRTPRYVFTSSMSVYPKGPDRHEHHFNPLEHPLRMGTSADFDYAEGKRQAEACLFQQDKLPTVAVRLPCVVGPDDYTRRLHFHIERTQHGEPIYFPVPTARISLIHAEEAAAFLYWLGTKSEVTGVFNACAEGPIGLDHLMQAIADVVGKTPHLAETKTENAHSPYGVSTDCFMNTAKARDLGFEFTQAAAWLPELIRSLADGLS